jgi:hypothetical protein
MVSVLIRRVGYAVLYALAHEPHDPQHTGLPVVLERTGSILTSRTLVAPNATGDRRQVGEPGTTVSANLRGTT